jgi:S1-C subfamily serine protease
MQEKFDTASPSDTSKWSDRFRKFRALIQRSWLFGAGVIASLLGVLLFSYLYPAPIPLTSSEIDEIVVQTMASATPPPAYSSVVYQIILPSLVYIQTQTEHSEDERFGVGSGVIINENGDILTAFHVLENAVLIEVIFADGTHATAEIIAAEPENDIAVLHPSQPPEVIVPAVLGSANAMSIGDEAYAVGNPLGLVGSMSAGVISGFNRSIPLNDGEDRLDGLIQFDTAVNPGNSGGPLLNRYGQVVGIVTALANPSEQNFFVGIGFAVPIQTAAAAAGAPDY